jgi:uncharacterized protein YndB with AHSA1/START domain
MAESPNVRTVSETEFSIEHTFHAPAAKVFGAYTDPKILPRWWAPPGGALTIDHMDVKPGGSYRFIQEAYGRKMAFVGKYLEVRPVTRLVYTFLAEGQGYEVTTTVELSERDGVTHAVMTNRWPSKEARDTAVQYGAERGARASWEQLAKVIAG